MSGAIREPKQTKQVNRGKLQLHNSKEPKTGTQRTKFDFTILNVRTKRQKAEMKTDMRDESGFSLPPHINLVI